ncbi:Salivary acidic proline-rich phosphoprotein 1/2 [Rhodosporidiobolus nylandii]
MPKRTTFTDTPSAPPTGSASPAPLTAPSPPASPSLAFPALSSPQKRANGAGGSPAQQQEGKAPKRPRVHVFDEEAEEKARERRENGGVNGAGEGAAEGNQASGKARKAKAAFTPEMKKKAADEAKRLLQGRMELPVYQGKDEILKGIEENDTVIVLGETGSGKTTQIPQFLLRSTTPCAYPRIVCTQPRRVAAISLAQRVAAEAGTYVGGTVGYTVRFDDRTSQNTRLKYATDGALLAELLGDKDLDAYDCVVLDEAHERSLRTDMLMGFLKDIQKRRKEKVKAWRAGGGKGKGRETEEGEKEKGRGKPPKPEDREPTELKIVVMSATIDAERFSEFFDNAPVLFVKGRQHKVTLKYTASPQADYLDAALKTVYQIHTKYPPGAVLVFLPDLPSSAERLTRVMGCAGQEEIESLQASIKSYAPDLPKSFPNADELVVTPLYAKLPAAEQAKAFEPAKPKTRKIILSTNVAETSVTIPGVRYVVDCGLAKEKRYHAGTGIDSLMTESISQSSAKQRAGRAGREADGYCFRLYTERAFYDLAKRTEPEIKRVSLTYALLHLLAAGQEDVMSFQYMDRPEKDAIVFALLTLRGLDALDSKGRITPLGQQMALLPLEPVYSRVLLSSFSEGCPREVLDLVSLLGSADQLLINTSATRDAATAARAKFIHRTGDHLMLLNILRAFEELEGKDERKQWCKDNFISLKAMNGVLDARKQLRERVERLKLGDWEQSAGDEAEPVLGALVGGLFANTAIRMEDGTYRHTVTKQLVSIHPSSSLHNKKAQAIVYDELVLTTKTYARGVSSIAPTLIKQKAPNVFSSSTSS